MVNAEADATENSEQKQPKVAIIIGAGPAGLTAAYELLQHTDIKPVIVEQQSYCGGLSTTVNYKGNGIDIGGHRFYSKSTWVMNWWQKFLHLADETSSKASAQQSGEQDQVMLKKNRLSRIVFQGKLFDYPLNLSFATLSKFKFSFLCSIGFSYLKSKVLPIKPEKSLADFYINRFGKVLYSTFFKNYTEKVWGIPCDDISPDWGAQRVKGLSVFKTLTHAIKQLFISKQDLAQKKRETSLIEQFIYPKKGPGQLWQTVADKVTSLGGEIHYNHNLVQYQVEQSIHKIQCRHASTGELINFDGQYLLSSMAIKDLIAAMSPHIPEEIAYIADKLCYRDYIIVGLLFEKTAAAKHSSDAVILEQMQDNWLYIQEDNVKIGRVQLFNNWSNGLVKDQNTLWVGLEYFCQQGDELWQKTDQQMADFGYKELEALKMAADNKLLDSTVIRMKKAYPAYWGSYQQLDKIKAFTNNIDNLFLIGRNGMHKYNNQDHAMLTAKKAVDCIINNSQNKSAIWQVNTETSYIEEHE